MGTTHIYGIKNCDTMKKATAWLDENGIAYSFYDYKKEGADAAVISRAIEAHGWDSVINRRGTTWRALPNDVKDTMNGDKALSCALENPSLIKRPLLIHNDQIYLGFSDDRYRDIFL